MSDICDLKILEAIIKNDEKTFLDLIYDYNFLRENIQPTVTKIVLSAIESENSTYYTELKDMYYIDEIIQKLEMDGHCCVQLFKKEYLNGFKRQIHFKTWEFNRKNIKDILSLPFIKMSSLQKTMIENMLDSIIKSSIHEINMFVNEIILSDQNEILGMYLEKTNKSKPHTKQYHQHLICALNNGKKGIFKTLIDAGAILNLQWTILMYKPESDLTSQQKIKEIKMFFLEALSNDEINEKWNKIMLTRQVLFEVTRTTNDKECVNSFNCLQNYIPMEERQERLIKKLKHEAQ